MCAWVLLVCVRIRFPIHSLSQPFSLISKLAFSTQCCLYALRSWRLLDGCGFFFWFKSYFMETVSLQSVGLCLSVCKGTLSKGLYVSRAFRMSLPTSRSQMHIINIITVSLYLLMNGKVDGWVDRSLEGWMGFDGLIRMDWMGKTVFYLMAQIRQFSSMGYGQSG